METILTRLHQMVWGPWTLLIFLMVGIGYTVKGGGFQLRGFSFWWRYTAGSLIRNRENLENGDVDERNSGKKESASFSPYVQHWQLLWERGILRGLLRP